MNVSKQFDYAWLQRGDGIARVKPNPDYPDGIDVDASVHGQESCMTPLPYPGVCVGTHCIECKICGTRVGVTAAGRPDDPRSIRVPCRPVSGHA